MMSLDHLFKNFDHSIKRVPASLFVSPEKLKKSLALLPNLNVVDIGKSREGRPMLGVVCGKGKKKVSLIAGCHADEPVGPMTLLLMCQWLSSQHLSKALLDEWTFILIPQMNPDGAERNKVWMESPFSFSRYFDHVIRELPGDDVEFGFPEDGTAAVRPENKNAADFLSKYGPYDAHFSLHSLGVGGGVWYLIGDNFSAESCGLRDVLKKETIAMGFDLLNIDRFGEKGFTRLDVGFSTSPTSVKMKEFFLAKNNQAMADKFHWSSMEFIKSLGGNPLMLVSEVPNFMSPKINDLLSKEDFDKKLRFEEARLKAFADENRTDAIANFLKEFQVKAMPTACQMSLQFRMIMNSLTWLASKSI